MIDHTRDAEATRKELIQALTRSIVKDASKHFDPNTEKVEIDRVAAEVAERLQFESNVALSEMVTRFAATKPKATPTEPTQERTFLRFGRNFRSQHMLMFISVIILIITGMPLKFPEFAISKFVIIDVFGGLQNSTLIHRVGAVGLIIVGAWHLVYIVFTRYGRRDFFLMIPRPKDAVDAFHTVMYYLGKRASGPKFGRFSFIEKFDYWAVYWGMVIMIGSGLILWFKELFDKGLFDIAREAHSDEGLLATLAIVIWHFYNVHFNPDVFPMSWVWWHGRLTETQMKHHHPLEYAEIVNAERAEVELRSDKKAEKGGAKS